MKLWAWRNTICHECINPAGKEYIWSYSTNGECFRCYIKVPTLLLHSLDYKQIEDVLFPCISSYEGRYDDFLKEKIEFIYSDLEGN